MLKHKPSWYFSGLTKIKISKNVHMCTQTHTHNYFYFSMKILFYLV